MDYYSCVAKRTRSQKKLYYNKHFYEMMKNIDESAPKTSRERAQSSSRVCVPKSKVNYLGYDDQCEETEAKEIDDILEIDVDHCEEMEFEGSKVNYHKEVNCDSIMNPKPKLELDESKVLDLDVDGSEVEGSNGNGDEDDHFDSVESKSAESDVEMLKKSRLNEAIIISSDEDDVTSYGPRTGKTELEVDGGSVSNRTRSKLNLAKKFSGVNRRVSPDNSDPLLISSDTNIDDQSDENFDAENYNCCVSMKESSSSSEEYEEEDYDLEEVDEEENEGSDHVKERSDTAPASKRRACSVDGVHEETGERISNFKGDDSDKQELGEERGSLKAEESWNSIDMKQVRAHEDCERRGQSDSKRQKKHCCSTWTYEVKGDKESNGISKENGKSNDKFNGGGADNEKLEKEKGGWKEGESSKSTNKSNNREEILGKRDEKSTKRKRLGELKGYDIFRILADSILDKGEALEDEAKQSSSDEYTLPLKFKFEDEEPEPVEKSDFEKMVDNLFAEMNFALKSEEMGSFDPPQVSFSTSFDPAEDYDKTNVLEAETNQTTLCRRGKHHLVLDEQIGLRCLHCSYVDIEIKYVLPPLRKYTVKVSERENYIGGEDLFMSDKLDFQASGDNFRDHPFNHTKGTVWDIIPGIRDSMYLHQQEGFEFLWKNLAGTINLAELKSSNSSNVGGCIISHAPGTGKTRLTIIFLKTYLKLFPNCRPVIIAPASMLLTWEEEFRKWKIEFPFHNLNNPEFSGKENKTALRFLPEDKCQNKDAVRMVKLYSWRNDKSILGVSYSLYEKLAGEKINTKGKGKKQKKVVLDKKIEKWRKILLDLPDLVVLDEGHTPRNQRSCIWNTLLKLQTERRIILSGTPFQNNFSELFNTLRLVRSAVAGLLAKERTFADMISPRCGKYYRKQSREARAIASRKVADDAIEMLKATIAPFVHVHKGSILQESLPGLRDCVLILNPPQLQKHIIDRIEGFPYMLEYEHKVALVSIHPSLLLNCSLSDKENSIIHHDTLEQLRLHPDKGVKTRFVVELIRLSVAMNEKVLIFSQYIHPLGLIKDQLREHFGWNEGKEVLQMQGKLDQRHRQNMINVFNCPKSDVKVLLASIKCCSEGINLVGASRVVLLDVVWNPSVERQAISRAYRLGQKKVVYTYHLMTSGTTEGDKYCRQAEKDRLSELVFSSTNKEKDKERNSTAVLNDKILDEMIGHQKLKNMFEKVIYQPKETNLIETFGLGSLPKTV